jgi:hypothetical protein
VSTREAYLLDRQIDAQFGLQCALGDVAFDRAYDGRPADDTSLISTQGILRDMLGAVPPERRWALAGEIARLGAARVAAVRGEAPEVDRMELTRASKRVLEDAAGAQIAAIRFLFGGVR